MPMRFLPNAIGFSSRNVRVSPVASGRNYRANRQVWKPL
nr:hypothetical protein [Klebsiella oxytoca]QEQ69814.1 hypothetical protein [Klebsiella pneumoniae]QEQ69974.1 hypothetical protein [Klebsiella pneumoniae]QEQ70547.1 hypothetical protein [Klebsiella pneumoniae]QVQ58710.1 hypothetical protein [Klebsiella pneumoniae]